MCLKTRGMLSNKSKKVFREREGPIIMEEGAAAIEQLGKRDGGLGSVGSSLDLP